MTLKSKLISLALGVFVTLTPAAISQTARTVMVQSNSGVLLFPTNLWSANASAARSGLGLGSLAQSNAVSISNVTGLQGALDSKLAANPTLAISNISGLQGALDGKLATNPTLAISNISGLQASLDSKLITNPTLAISNISGLQGALDGKLATNPLIAVANGGTGATNAGGARTNLGLGAAWLTNTDVTNFRTAIELGAANSVTFSNVTASGTLNVAGAIAVTNASATRANLGLGSSWLTNTNAANFRAAIGLGSSDSVSFSSLTVSGIGTGGSGWATVGPGGSIGRLSPGGSGPEASVPVYVDFAHTSYTLNQLRTNLGLGWSALTNTNSATSLLGVSTNGRVVTSTNVTFTNDVRALSSILVGTNLSIQVNGAGMSGFDSSISLEEGFLVLHDGASSWNLSGSGFLDVGTIAFVDTNAAASTRNNLRLGWSGLTNTNAATFQGALFAATNAAPTDTTNVAAWINLQVGTNTYKLPLYQ